MLHAEVSCVQDGIGKDVDQLLLDLMHSFKNKFQHQAPPSPTQTCSLHSDVETFLSISFNILIDMATKLPATI